METGLGRGMDWRSNFHRILSASSAVKPFPRRCKTGLDVAGDADDGEGGQERRRGGGGRGGRGSGKI